MSKSLTGIVTSDRGDKTIVITVTERKTHPLYKKQYTVTTKYMAHDEKNEAKPGDRVVIVETKPISARKRFTLDKVVAKAAIGFKEADAVADVPEGELHPVPEKTANQEPAPSEKAEPAKPKKTEAK